MNKSLRASALASAIALALGSLALGSGGAAVAGDPKPRDIQAEKVADARSEAQILTSYAMNPHLRAFDLSVTVDGSHAVLGGNVEDSVAKDLAEQIANGASGITNVDNRIRIDAGFVRPPHALSERTFAEKVDDATITASVKSRVLWNSGTDGLDIHVDTINGKVTLTGSAGSNTEELLAARIARDTEGVIGVNNEIALAGQPHAAAKVRPTGPHIEDAVSDSWITTKVKSSLALTRNIDSFDIGVTTIDGVVSLHGVVDTAAEREHAMQVTHDIRGVKKVDAKDLTVG
jgi:hyperosmotically inducible protein